MTDRGGSVLVLTNRYDVTSDVVLRKLAERQVPVMRLDPGADPHAGASLSAGYGRAGHGGTLRTASRELGLTECARTCSRPRWTRRSTAGCGTGSRRTGRGGTCWCEVLRSPEPV